MKLSFSIPSSKSSSKSHSKPKQQLQEEEEEDDSTKQKHLITEFDPSKPPTLPSSTNTLIPPIQNEWTPLKKLKMQNLHLPLTDPNNSQSLTFEQDTSSTDPDSAIPYGLNIRKTSDQKPPPPDSQKNNNNNAVLQRRPEDTMLQKLKHDLKRLPEDQGFDEYKDVPIEGFGAAVLAGYGWSEGMGIGKNAKEDVKIFECKRRTAKEGLGFVGDAPPASIPKKKKEEEEERQREGTVAKKKEKIVRIVGGRDVGLKGTVVATIGDDDYLVLKLSGSREQVKVKVDDVAELGSIEEERCLRKLKTLKIQGRREGDKGYKNKRGRDEKVEERRVEVEQGKNKQVSWLTSHIRVRVVSRDLKGGRLYLKKGEVLDVVGPATCDISMDESREIIQGVSQDWLETAIPRRGGPVLVLYGRHKGAYGNLVERDLDREMAIVRDADTHELLNVKLEQIAEYIGDPSLLGH